MPLMDQTASLKGLVKRVPVFGAVAAATGRWLRGGSGFSGSRDYWQRRYAQGGNSGAGSYDRLAHFKAEVINAFVAEKGVRNVIEYGSGDGMQLRLARYPEYLGFDVSEEAVRQCRSLFAGDASKRFRMTDEYASERADLTMSLDVIYHLVEDPVFDNYMRLLFDSADRYVIVYASNSEALNPPGAPAHVRHRNFTGWVEANRPGWRLAATLPNRYPFDAADPDNTSHADFFFYEKS